MLRNMFFDMWQRMQAPVAADDVVVPFRKGIALIEQQDDPFHEVISGHNGISRAKVIPGAITIELVISTGIRLYYGIYYVAPDFIDGRTGWHCVRRLNRGDKLWNTIMELGEWKLCYISPVVLQILKEADDDAAGCFEDDPVWKSVRGLESGTSIEVQYKHSDLGHNSQAEFG